MYMLRSSDDWHPHELTDPVKEWVYTPTLYHLLHDDPYTELLECLFGPKDVMLPPNDRYDTWIRDPHMINTYRNPSHFRRYLSLSLDRLFNLRFRDSRTRVCGNIDLVCKTSDHRYRVYQIHPSINRYVRVLNAAVHLYLRRVHPGLFESAIYILHPTDHRVIGTLDYDGDEKPYLTILRKIVFEKRFLRSRATIIRDYHIPLYPNMCHKNTGWDKEKEAYAQQIGELTLLWNVGLSHRKHAHQNHRVYSFYDPRCCANVMNVAPHLHNTIDKIIEINRQDRDWIWVHDLSLDGTGCFLDVETLPSRSNLIYYIGLYLRETEEYLWWMCDEPTPQQEQSILERFQHVLASRSLGTIYYWYAERSFFRNKLPEECMSSWVDLYQVFWKTPIVIRGCFHYRLKHIARVLKQKGKIETHLGEDDCADGLESVRIAEEYYRTRDPGLFEKIYRYNRFDCKVLSDIMDLLHNILEEREQNND